MAHELGLTKTMKLSIDGTYIKGNVSGKKGCKTLKKRAEIEKELDIKISEYEELSRKVDSKEDDYYGHEQGLHLPEDLRNAEKRRKKIRETLEKLKDEDKRQRDS